MHFLFDIGGTKTRLAVSSDGESVENATSFLTPPTFDEGMKAIEKSLQTLSVAGKITGAAGGVAGILDAGKSWLFYSPHLSDWEKKPLKDTLEKIIGASVVLENDAALAGLGEAVVGAGKGYQIVAYVTVGTGVGGARIVHEKIDERSIGFEPGHQIVRLGEHGEFVELESLVSGAGIKGRTGKTSDEISDPSFWNEVAQYLAVGLNNTILHWSPQIVILGGGMINEDIISLELVTEHLSKMFVAFPDIPPLQKAQLKDQSALFGGLQLIETRP
jgi:predicted NBD/HSP70 family sugar kinase